MDRILDGDIICDFHNSVLDSIFDLVDRLNSGLANLSGDFILKDLRIEGFKNFI